MVVAGLVVLLVVLELVAELELPSVVELYASLY